MPGTTRNWASQTQHERASCLLATLSILLSLIAAATLIFVLTSYWHVLPRDVLPSRLSRILYSGVLTTWGGLVPSAIAVALAFTILVRRGRNGFRLCLCLWTTAVLVSFGLALFFATYS